MKPLEQLEPRGPAIGVRAPIALAYARAIIIANSDTGMQMISLVLSVMVAVPSVTRAGQDSVRAVVEGRLLDTAGRPIAEGEVIWQDDHRSVMSRADGSFNLVVPFRGVTVVLVRRVGFSSQVLRVDLTRGIWRGNIMLQPGSFALPDVVVSARAAKPAEYAGTAKYDDFFRRSKLGLGTFVSRADIERMNAIHTIEILRGIPGVYVAPGNPADPASADIRMSRCTESMKNAGGGGRLGKVAVYIDGVRQIPHEGDAGEHGPGSFQLADMLARISASGIEMMEIFRGASQIPGEYHWDGCAVVAIWTRYNPVQEGVQPQPDTTRSARPW